MMMNCFCGMVDRRNEFSLIYCRDHCQSDGVSMGSSLAPLLANIILTEFEKVAVTTLMKSGILKFYCRYVDDTLVLVKED